MIRHPKFFLLLSAALFISSLHAQLFRSKRPGHLDSMMTFWNTQDTNYIRKYPDRFIVTLSQSFREYDVGFSQTLVQDTAGWGAPDLVANANKSNSISVDFDKISFCLGLNTVPPTDDVLRKRGKTTYKTLTLSFGAYRFRFETGYRSYHGFYDKKTPAYDSLFDSTGVYYQDPSMNVRSLRVKTIFIFNKRHFSYNSAYFNTQRQLKTSGSLLLCNNLYDDRFSSDTSMIPRP
ncbi:MAG TPA: DUF4421 family protein, partial [Bacteroidia bacterium]|nr:DUF4421 family protein [Bacteroidia bacterium]